MKFESKQRDILQALKARSSTAEPERLTQVINQTLHEGERVSGEQKRGTLAVARSTSIPLPDEVSMPFSLFPDIRSPYGKFNYSAVDSSHHVLNCDSGNTTTTIIQNSNNDSSVRVESST